MNTLLEARPVETSRRSTPEPVHPCPCILVVEDEALVRQIIVRVLLDFGNRPKKDAPASLPAARYDQITTHL